MDVACLTYFATTCPWEFVASYSVVRVGLPAHAVSRGGALI